MKTTIQKAIYEVMKDGNLYTIWDLKELIALRYEVYSMETSISAIMRSFRWDENRARFNLPRDINVEVLVKQNRPNGKGYLYKLITEDK
tara:strand:+ start:85 stop:351 length:267 start_codon:yes stop_codon:yes gene_type:complete